MVIGQYDEYIILMRLAKLHSSMSSRIATWDITSIGTGKIIVLLFSAEMLFNVWRYLS